MICANAEMKTNLAHIQSVLDHFERVDSNQEIDSLLDTMLAASSELKRIHEANNKSHCLANTEKCKTIISNLSVLSRKWLHSLHILCANKSLFFHPKYNFFSHVLKANPVKHFNNTWNQKKNKLKNDSNRLPRFLLLLCIHRCVLQWYEWIEYVYKNIPYKRYCNYIRVNLEIFVTVDGYASYNN